MVKRFRDLATAQREWESLHIVKRSTVATPDPIRLCMFDGSPVVVMSALAGAPTLRPSNVDLWLTGLGRALAQIHATPAPDPAPRFLRRPPLVAFWRPWPGAGSLLPTITA